MSDIIAMVCTTTVIATHTADAILECPVWKREVCSMAAVVKQLNDAYKRDVRRYMYKRRQLYTNVRRILNAHNVNQQLNNSLIRIFYKAEMLDTLKTRGSSLLVPEWWENTHNTAVVAGTDELMTELTKPLRGSRRSVKQIFGAIGLVHSLAAVIRATANQSRRSDPNRGSLRPDLKLSEMVKNDGKYIINDYLGVWSVNGDGDVQRRTLSRTEPGETGPININREVYQRDYFQSEMVRDLGPLLETHTFPDFDSGILGISLCVYNFDTIIQSDIAPMRAELNEVKSHVQTAQRNSDANFTALDTVARNTRENFQAVTNVTIMFAGLIFDSVNRAANRWNNNYADVVSTMPEFQYIRQQLSGGNVNYTNLADLQGKIRHILHDMEHSVDMNVRFAKIIQQVNNALQSSNSPTQMLTSLQNEGLNDITLISILKTIAALRPNLNFYFGWPLCKVRNGQIANQRDLDGANIGEMSQDLRAHVLALHNITSITVPDMALLWNRQNPSTRHVTPRQIWQIIAREIQPDSVDFRGQNLAAYRRC